MKNKIILVVALFIIFTAYKPDLAYSYDNGVNSEKVNINIEEKSENSIYKPGDTDNIKFSIDNSSDSKIKINNIYLSIDKPSSKSFDQISKYTKVSISYNDYIIVEDLLKNFLTKKNNMVNIELDPGKSIVLDLTLDIDKSLGNEAQNVCQEIYVNADYEVYDNEIHNDGNYDDNYTEDTLNKVLPQTGVPLRRGFRS